MRQLEKEDLMYIKGGAISGAILTSIIRGINSLYEIGRSLGSSVRRLFTRNFC